MKKIIALVMSFLIALSVAATAFAAPAAPDIISADEAKSIALEHAKVDESKVRFTKEKLEFDDGIYEYEIEFRTNDNWEYDYVINAESGNIIECEKEYDSPDWFETLFHFDIVEIIRNIFAKLFG